MRALRAPLCSRSVFLIYFYQALRSSLRASAGHQLVLLHVSCIVPPSRSPSPRLPQRCRCVHAAHFNPRRPRLFSPRTCCRRRHTVAFPQPRAAHVRLTLVLQTATGSSYPLFMLTRDASALVRFGALACVDALINSLREAVRRLYLLSTSCILPLLRCVDFFATSIWFWLRRPRRSCTRSKKMTTRCVAAITAAVCIFILISYFVPAGCGGTRSTHRQEFGGHAGRELAGLLVVGASKAFAADTWAFEPLFCIYMHVS